jgi:hypothetical protein
VAGNEVRALMDTIDMRAAGSVKMQTFEVLALNTTRVDLLRREPSDD